MPSRAHQADYERTNAEQHSPVSSPLREVFYLE